MLSMKEYQIQFKMLKIIIDIINENIYNWGKPNKKRRKNHTMEG